MRFFSNDSRESADDQAKDEQVRDARAHDDGPDVVRSEPVAVPNQRPPSPWSNTPPVADGTTADPDAGGVPDRNDIDAPPFHEPSPQPTAFGASTVGGAVAASAMANPENDRWNATDRDSAADTGVGDDANVAPGDGAVHSSTSKSTVTPPDAVPATWSQPRTADRQDPDAVVDIPLDDTRATPPGAIPPDSGVDRDRNQDDSVIPFDEGREGGAVLKDDGDFDHPQAVDPATATPLAGSAVDAETAAPDATVGSAPLKDEGGFDDPKAVDPATGTPLDRDDTAPSDSAPPVVAAVPVAAAAGPAGSAATTEADTLFDQDDARTFQERWREVQLRFVDSPKDAAADAAELVEEAVEKLTANLRAQRDGLTHDTDDTEQLRVQLRGYRDMLNRILSL
jgi:hypothetical protein